MNPIQGGHTELVSITSSCAAGLLEMGVLKAARLITEFFTIQNKFVTA
jgi:hypothetical protein